MPLLQTPLCRRLGLEYPIIQAPIGRASRPELVAAVANGGGLGMVAGSWLSPAALRRAIQETRALSPKPFGVNFVLEWDQSERLDVALAEGVRIISLTWGDPTALIPRITAAGAFAIHTVSSAAEAVAVQQAGVDAVVAQRRGTGGRPR